MSLVARWLGAETVYRFHTVLPLEECRRRLEVAIYSDDVSAEPDWETSVLGDVGSRSFELLLGKYAGNPLAPHFYGRLHQTSRGTEVSGRVRPQLGAAVFFTAIVVFILFVFLYVLPRPPHSGPIPVFTWRATVVLVAIIPLAIAASNWMMRSAREQCPRAEAELIRFLQHTMLVAEGQSPHTQTGSESTRTPLRLRSSRSAILSGAQWSAMAATLLAILGLMIAGSRGLLDPERYAPYVFGSYALIFGGSIAIFPRDYVRMHRRHLGSEVSPLLIRLMGLFFVVIGAALMYMGPNSTP